MKIPDNLTPTEEYRGVLEIVHQRATKLLKINLFPHYTKHDIVHSDRILTLISKLLKFAIIELSDQEKFILCCAAYLHDIGMCTTKFIGDGKKNADELSPEDKDEIRKQHHISSSKLINGSINHLPEDTYYLGLHSKPQYVEAIAEVAKSHGENSLDGIDDDFIGLDNRVRVDLICALLRLGDLLDITEDRVDIEQLNIISINNTSEIHWFCHAYVSGVQLEKPIIKLFFSFPKEYDTDDNKLVTEHIQNLLRRKINSQLIKDKNTWNKHGFRFHDNIEFKTKFVAAIRSKMKIEVKEKLIRESGLRSEKYTSGLGEIEFYWGGNRENANNEIQKYLETTSANEIFIAAIGFGTIEAVLTAPNVLRHIKANMHSRPDFKIVFVVPGNEKHLFKIRPDRDKKKLAETFKNGKQLLTKFIMGLKDESSDCLTKEKILSRIEFRNYRNRLIPRHFILYGNENDNSTIFVGSYLGHTEGKKSYMIKLRKDDGNGDSAKDFVPGIFELFEREINHIRDNSRKDDDLHAMMDGIKGE